jgi:hypothetical protein
MIAPAINLSSRVHQENRYLACSRLVIKVMPVEVRRSLHGVSNTTGICGPSEPTPCAIWQGGQKSCIVLDRHYQHLRVVGNLSVLAPASHLFLGRPIYLLPLGVQWKACFGIFISSTLRRHADHLALYSFILSSFGYVSVSLYFIISDSLLSGFTTKTRLV